MKRYLLNILGIFIFLSVSVYSQVGIYPQAVFLSLQNRTGSLTIMNNSEQVKEVSIEIKFGYVGYDSLGKSKVLIGDSLPDAKLHSAVPYVKVFPKKLLLKAKEEQAVKFMLGNIGNIDDGTYYARILILSKNPAGEIDTSYSNEVKAKVDIQFTLMAALLIEKGKKDCNIKINNPIASVDTSDVIFHIGFEKGGNSPFMGTTEINIYDLGGDKIADTKEVMPVYFSGNKSFKFNKKKFKNGQYKLEILMTNEHKDVPKEFKIPFEPLKQSFIVNVDGKF
jgi:hypothetical protein